MFLFGSNMMSSWHFYPKLSAQTPYRVMAAIWVYEQIHSTTMLQKAQCVGCWPQYHLSHIEQRCISWALASMFSHMTCNIRLCSATDWSDCLILCCSEWMCRYMWCFDSSWCRDRHTLLCKSDNSQIVLYKITQIIYYAWRYFLSQWQLFWSFIFYGSCHV